MYNCERSLKVEYHKPVLFDEVIDNIITEKKAVYVDCTLGGGGHTEGILEKSSDNSVVIGIDQDMEAIGYVKKRLEKYGDKLQVFQDNFRNIDTIVYFAGYDKVDRILMDIGVSSNQLDNIERGFSYRYEAKLDMRMNKDLSVSAYDVVNKFSDLLKKAEKPIILSTKNNIAYWKKKNMKEKKKNTQRLKEK